MLLGSDYVLTTLIGSAHGLLYCPTDQREQNEVDAKITTDVH